MSEQPRCASVALPVPVRRQFTYRVDEALASRLAPGVRVRVPLAGRRMVGTIVAWPVRPPKPEVKLKAIEAVLPGGPLLGAELLELTRFVSDYYLCSWGDAIAAALPPDVDRRMVPAFARRTAAADPAGLPRRATARRSLLERLPADGGVLPLNRLAPSERRAVRPLVALGWVELVGEAALIGGSQNVEVKQPSRAARVPRPTAAQSGVLATLLPPIAQRGYKPFLLFGATGSGKTEVYLQAAERTLATGRGVLYLVPEIGLTPLLLSEVERRFPGQVATLHSGLGRAERRRAWHLVRRGARRFVLGTRSAVFAPLEDPGLIIVDEEQDSSYKQEETPRYHGRDLAVVRAQRCEAVIVLGSATPSMESFHHARGGRYRLLELGGRIASRPLAQVQIVDMREEYRRHGEIRPLSSALVDELHECLERGEQALVLRNRRGWAAALICPRCGSRVCCANCSISMTWHRAASRLRCHSCGTEQSWPPACPTCAEPELKTLGEGSERIEAALRSVLPEAVIERMDRDTIRRRGAHERLLRRFARGEVQVLVGTQMIAKGHDFPRVTLVGVLSADQTLGLPDFRAAERAFQLLTQVAGRAGRGRAPGRVVVQAFSPEHPVLRLAADQDYEAFFERELRYRRALRYPPVSGLVQLLVHDRHASQAREWAECLAQALRQEGRERLLFCGPGPAPIERAKGLFRQQLLLRSAGRRRLVEAVDRALRATERTIPRRALVVDVDAQSLL